MRAAFYFFLGLALALLTMLLLGTEVRPGPPPLYTYRQPNGPVGCWYLED